ncbi:MAG: ABC transporter permease [Thermoanaerobaculales bacterium]|jgi:ABC-2 type transport system permease protein|nr:ABC transporter permease [Thermoanaerobaculales bacterium]
MLDRILAIMRREYLERVKTKAFWISTLLVPVFLGAVMIIPAWLAARGGGAFTVGVLDFTGRFAEPIRLELDDLIGRQSSIAAAALEQSEVVPGEQAETIGEIANDPILELELVELATDGDPEAARERAKQGVQDGAYDGLLVLPATLPDEGQAEYVSPNVSTFQMLSVLERSVNNVMVADRLTTAGLDPEAVGELTRRVDLKTLKLGAKGQETHDQGQGFLVSYVFMMIIYMTVLMYGIYVMRGVLEEKASHIVEVIISTVKPFELMLGKILGIGAVGLTQFLLWSALMVAISAPGAASALGMGSLELPAVPAVQIVFFVVYFVLGFLLYGTLYAGIGAAFDTEQEAQNFQGVITMFLIVPLVLMMYILNQPDAPLSVALSLFPFFTPMLMFLRMTLTQVPAVQLLGSVVLMTATIVAAAWVVGKVYRVGILMHGSKPKLKDLWRWIREA